MVDEITGPGADGTTPVGDQDESLRARWGNVDYVAGPLLEKTLRKVIDATEQPQALELGSGYTTLLLSEWGVPHIALEHIEDWAQKVLDFDESANVYHTPLKDYGEYEWYDISEILWLTKINVVLVDGPPRATTKGDRVGFPYVMHQGLAPGCLIIVDDANSQAEIIAEWGREFGIVPIWYAAEGNETIAVLEYPGPGGVE